jgi:hypothetical protein
LLNFSFYLVVGILIKLKMFLFFAAVIRVLRREDGGVRIKVLVHVVSGK